MDTLSNLKELYDKECPKVVVDVEIVDSYIDT
jgi:hypothetical protein